MAEEEHHRFVRRERKRLDPLPRGVAERELQPGTHVAPVAVP